MIVRVAFFRLVRLTVLLAAAGVLQTSSSARVIPGTATQISPAPSFDIVSIHPMKNDDSTPTHITNPSRHATISAVNVNVKALLEVAYDIPDLRMLGGPAWLKTAKFSLEAKSDTDVEERLANLSPGEARQVKRRMLAALLADRFRIVVHTETREMPVYALVNAKGGARLDAPRPGADTASTGNDRIEIQAGSDSLEVLTYELSWRLGRPVLNRTGLQDREALTVRWQDESGAAADSSGPSLTAALQEQLGLKLESTRAPVPVLVIDHAERPTEN